MCDLDPSIISSEYDLLVFENVLLKLYKNDKKKNKKTHGTHRILFDCGTLDPVLSSIITHSVYPHN